MISASGLFYTKTPECLITVFDLRHPGAEERLRREHDAWGYFVRTERLTLDHTALIISPGAAAELMA